MASFFCSTDPELSISCSTCKGITPRNNLSLLTILILLVSAMMGKELLNLASILAEKPPCVIQRSLSIWVCLERLIIIFEQASLGSVVSSSVSRSRSGVSSSLSLMTVAMTLTACSGLVPIAVSPESMTADAPSMTAPAISATSDFFGNGWVTIECSISVATMTGFARLLPSSMICFCNLGTFWKETSLPRSPRSIMMPYAASMMPETFLIAS